MGVEVEVVHIDVETSAVIGTVLFKRILQQESSFSDTSTTLDANQAVAPINLVDKFTAYWRINMLHQILVCSVKRLHCYILLQFIICSFAVQIYKKIFDLQSKISKKIVKFLYFFDFRVNQDKKLVL